MTNRMNEMLNVLLFIDWFLPGTDSGGPVRSYTNMIDHLEKELNFYVVTRDTDYCSNEPYNNIEYNKWNKLKSNLFVWYLAEKEIKKSTFRKIERSKTFQKIYINGIYSYKFSILPLLSFKERKNDIVVSARGMLNPQAFSVKGFKKKLFLSIARITGLYRNITFHATNQNEGSFIKSILGERTKVIIASNFPRKLSKNILFKKNKKEIGGVELVCIARIAKEKGTLKMLEIIGKIKTGYIKLDIFGPIYDLEYWRECEQVIKELGDNIMVNYKGVLVSESVPRTLAQYDFFIMLSEGENFGHSILEAMSVGLPVLISNRTPWIGLEKMRVGWDIDSLEVQKIVEVLEKMIQMKDEEYNEWSNSALVYAENIINDPITKEQNKTLFSK